MKIVLEAATSMVQNCYNTLFIISFSKNSGLLMPLFLKVVVAHSRSSRIVRSPFEAYMPTPLCLSGVCRKSIGFPKNMFSCNYQ